MDSSDIIEIGEDGTFEIPKPTKKPVKMQTEIFIEKVKPNKEAEKELQQPTSVLDSISSGEYKIFRSKSTGMVDVIVHLQEDENLKEVNVSQYAILIDLQGGKDLQIPLPFQVASNTAESTMYQKYITIRVKAL